MILILRTILVIYLTIFERTYVMSLTSLSVRQSIITFEQIPCHFLQRSTVLTSYGKDKFQLLRSLLMKTIIIFFSAKRTVGLLWLNSAETWVDVDKKEGGLLGSVYSYFAGQETIPEVHECENIYQQILKTINLRIIYFNFPLQL